MKSQVILLMLFISPGLRPLWSAPIEPRELMKAIHEACPKFNSIFMDEICETERLSFEGLQSEYASVNELQGSTVAISNKSDKLLNVDPGQVRIPLLFRLNQETGVWEEMNVHRCANVGYGTPRTLEALADIQSDVPIDSPLVSVQGHEPYVQTSDFRERNVTGVYRLGLRYSVDPWQMLSPPKEKFISFSQPFALEGP